MQLPDAELISTAKRPFKATYPHGVLVTLFAFAASCIVGILLALLLERHHVGFRSAEEFEAETGTPILGLVPTIPRGRRRPFSLRLQRPDHREAISSISARLWTRDVGVRHSRVIMVTSGVPAEGKTAFAVSLGASFARGGRRTLLIDCDLRRPTVAHVLDLRGPGLDSLNRGRSSDESLQTAPLDEPAGVASTRGRRLSIGRDMTVRQVLLGTGIVTTVSVGFDVIPAFPSSLNPIEFLTGPPLRELIENARSNYDVIVLDTPAVLAVPDAMLVSCLADGVVLAARWGHTPRPVVASALRSLTQYGAHIEGAVLTRVNTRKYAAWRLGSHSYIFRSYARYYAGTT
jgi:Mrp family chromosome partitioning ATPase